MTDSEQPDEFIAKILPPVVPRRQKKGDNNSSVRKVLPPRSLLNFRHPNTGRGSGGSSGSRSNPHPVTHRSNSGGAGDRDVSPSSSVNVARQLAHPPSSPSQFHVQSSQSQSTQQQQAQAAVVTKLQRRHWAGFQTFGDFVLYLSDEGNASLYKVNLNDSPMVSPTESQQTWPAPATSPRHSPKQLRQSSTVDLKNLGSWEVQAKKVLCARGMLFYLDTQVRAMPLWVATNSSRLVSEPPSSFKGSSNPDVRTVDFCLGTSEDGTLRVYTIDSARMIRIFDFEHLDIVKLVNAFSVPGDITAIQTVGEAIFTIGRMPETTHDGTLTTASGYIRVWDHVGNSMNVLAPAAGHPTPIVGMVLTRLSVSVSPFNATLPAKNVLTWSRDGSIRKWKLAHSSFKSKELATNLVLDELCHVAVGQGKGKSKYLVVHNLRTKQLYIIPHKATSSPTSGVAATTFAGTPSPTPGASSASASSSNNSNASAGIQPVPNSPNVIRSYDKVTAFAVHKSTVFFAYKTSKTTCNVVRIERASRKHHDYEPIELDGIVDSMCARKKPDACLLLAIRGERELTIAPWPQRRVADD